MSPVGPGQGRRPGREVLFCGSSDQDGVLSRGAGWHPLRTPLPPFSPGDVLRASHAGGVETRVVTANGASVSLPGSQTRETRRNARQVLSGRALELQGGDWVEAWTAQRRGERLLLAFPGLTAEGWEVRRLEVHARMLCAGVGASLLSEGQRPLAGRIVVAVARHYAGDFSKTPEALLWALAKARIESRRAPVGDPAGTALAAFGFLLGGGDSTARDVMNAFTSRRASLGQPVEAQRAAISRSLAFLVRGATPLSSFLLGIAAAVPSPRPSRRRR